jgi:hypothetical protein
MPFTDIINISQLPISAKTTARRLHEVHLYSRYAVRKPYLSKEYKAARVDWAQDKKDWPLEKWRKVIWSDECYIRIGVDPRRQRVIRPNGHALDARYLKPTFKTTQVTIMIWACFTTDRLGPIIVLDKGGVDAKAYLEILCDGLLSFIDDLIGTSTDVDTPAIISTHDLQFMHDNARCHIDRRVKSLLQEYNIPLMPWPAQSPDLNPIENLWPDIKHRFHLQFLDLGQNPSTAAHAIARYSAMIKDVWENTDIELVRKVVLSMPERVDRVIERKGGHTGF